MTFVVILHYPLKSLCKLQIRKGSREGGKIRSWWGKQWNTKGGRIFGKNWDTWSIILGENSAEHCFELRDLVPASFLKNPYLSYLPYFPYLSLNGTSWSPHKETMRRVLGLFTVMILKTVSERISFQINKFTASTVKDEKEVTNSLMVFNLLNIIHPFQGKKHLKTYWNLNSDPHKYLFGY